MMAAWLTFMGQLFENEEVSGKFPVSGLDKTVN